MRFHKDPLLPVMELCLLFVYLFSLNSVEVIRKSGKICILDIDSEVCYLTMDDSITLHYTFYHVN